MDILPFRLNFFKQVELFLTLRQLDKQNDKMIEDYNFEKEKNKTLQEKADGGHISLSWPTWEMEKKVLRWTFLNHKHLKSPITVKKMRPRNEQLEQDDFLIKLGGSINISGVMSEIIYANEHHILNNLIIRGFANSVDYVNGCEINQEGLNIGSLLTKHYKFTDDVLPDGTSYNKLVPKTIKNIGYQLLYWTAIFLIFYSVFFFSINIIDGVGLLDDLKVFLLFLYPIKWVVIFSLLIPVITIALALLLILPNKIK